MATLTISPSDLRTYTSSVTTKGVVVGDGWNRFGNTVYDRITGCAEDTGYNVNWRTFVEIPKEKLTSIADKKITSVRLIVQPKANNACAIGCTQAILTNKTLNVLSDHRINLLDNSWCTQADIRDRFGDCGLSGTGKTNFEPYTASGPYTKPSGNATPSTITKWWDKDETAPTMQYIFNNVNNIKFNEDLGFYIIRYKPDPYPSGIGKSGWLYTTVNSWSVEIDYVPNYEVTVDVNVNGHDAGDNFMYALSKNNGITIKVTNGSKVTYRNFPNRNHVNISIPAGSQITLMQEFTKDIEKWVRVSESSDFNTESDRQINAATTINVSFDLKVEFTFLSNEKGPNPEKSSSLNLFYNQFEKYYGDVIYLPLNPGIEYDDPHPTIKHRSPDMFFSGATYWDYVYNTPIRVMNERGNSIPVPDLYDDADFVFGTWYVPDFLLTGETLPRKYTFNNELDIELGGITMIWTKDQNQSEYTVDYSANSDPLADMKSYNTEIFQGSRLSYIIGDNNIVSWDTILDEVYINNKEKVEAKLSWDELSYDVSVKTYIEPILKLMYKNNSGITECLPYEQTQANVGIPLFPVLIQNENKLAD